MIKKRILIISILIILFCGVLGAGCVSETTTIVNSGISVKEGYGDVLLSATSDDFDAAGFVLGDSVNICFSNGKTLMDIPYVSGYVLPDGTIALIKNYDWITLCTINYSGLWNKLELNPEDTITVVRGEKQKYAFEQKVNSYSISTNRSEYSSDEEFCNFRPLNYGNLKENYLYRGVSPIGSSEKRAHITDTLLEKYGIKTILSLTGSDNYVKELQQKSNHNSPYFDKLYAEGSVIMSGIPYDIFEEKNKKIIINGLRSLLSHDGPIYFHCMEGKDRTGFLAIIFEALGDATEEEIIEDYLKTYENFYHITKESEPKVFEHYVITKFSPLYNELTKNSTISLKDGAISYLKEGGMTEAEIEELISKITK